MPCARRHILGGVQYSLELCSAGSGLAGGLSGASSSLFRLQGTGAVTRASSQAAAAAFVNERLRKALDAAHTSAGVVTALQVYFSGGVVPVVSGSVGELSAASSALLALIRAVEDSITVVLRKCVDAFVGEVRACSGLLWGEASALQRARRAAAAWLACVLPGALMQLGS